MEYAHLSASSARRRIANSARGTRRERKAATAAPAQRGAWPVQAKKSGIRIGLVRTAGIEPAHHLWRGILSALRLPVSPRPRRDTVSLPRRRLQGQALHACLRNRAVILDKPRSGAAPDPTQGCCALRWILGQAGMTRRLWESLASIAGVSVGGSACTIRRHRDRHRARARHRSRSSSPPSARAPCRRGRRGGYRGRSPARGRASHRRRRR